MKKVIFVFIISVLFFGCKDGGTGGDFAISNK